MPIAQIGHPILRGGAENIKTMDKEQIKTLISNMKFTVENMNGVGLAAPQVFQSLNLMIMSSKPNPRYPSAPYMPITVLANSLIVEKSSNLIEGWEGCLSIPGLRAKVPRHEWVRIQYLDESDRQHTQTFSGFLARIFQHEYDHIIGLTFLDHVTNSRNIMSEKEWQRQIQESP